MTVSTITIDGVEKKLYKVLSGGKSTTRGDYGWSLPAGVLSDATDEDIATAAMVCKCRLPDGLMVVTRSHHLALFRFAEEVQGSLQEWLNYDKDDFEADDATQTCTFKIACSVEKLRSTLGLSQQEAP